MEGVAQKYNKEENKGIARIERFNISKENSKKYNLLCTMNGEPYFMRIEDGNYVRLWVDGVLMMSDTHMERYTNQFFIDNAHGDVMIAGLGVGLILNALENNTL